MKEKSLVKAVMLNISLATSASGLFNLDTIVNVGAV